MKTMKRIEIKSLRGEILFACSSENNTRAKTLERAVIHGVNLLNAELIAEQLIDIDLRHARLRGADLRFTIFRGSDFTGADLRGADLRGANCLGIDFTDTDLRGCDLRGTYYYKKQIDSAITDEKTRFWDD